MIRAEQIPMEVVEAAAYVYRTVPLYTTHDDAIRAAIAAALNAWPDAGIEEYVNGDRGIFLPLPQEPRDE